MRWQTTRKGRCCGCQSGQHPEVNAAESPARPLRPRGVSTDFSQPAGGAGRSAARTAARSSSSRSSTCPSAQPGSARRHAKSAASFRRCGTPTSSSTGSPSRSPPLPTVSPTHVPTVHSLLPSPSPSPLLISCLSLTAPPPPPLPLRKTESSGSSWPSLRCAQSLRPYLSSLTPSSRASLLPRPRSILIPFFPLVVIKRIFLSLRIETTRQGCSDCCIERILVIERTFLAGRRPRRAHQGAARAALPRGARPRLVLPGPTCPRSLHEASVKP
jgi:hypothetical protein